MNEQNTSTEMPRSPEVQMKTEGISMWGSERKQSGELNAFPNTGLDWDVTKNPLVTLLEGKYPLPITSHMSINRSDTEESIGIVGKGYEPIQNSRVWEALHRALNGVPFNVMGAGYTHHGGRIFIQAKVDGSADMKVNGDDFLNYFTLYSSHDGSSAFEIFDTSLRICCRNTLQAARRIGGKQFKLKVRHTRTADIRFENMMDQLDRIMANRQRTYRDLNYLNEIMLDRSEMLDWAVGFFNQANNLTGGASGKASESVRLAHTGTGNRGETAYDLLNGVTEMLTHGRDNTTRPATSLFKTSEFGSAADQKAHALDLLVAPRAFGRLVQRGRELRNDGTTTINRGAQALMSA
jgi:phage/plasmid-like protein (TIGR03299 family)